MISPTACNAEEINGAFGLKLGDYIDIDNYQLEKKKDKYGLEYYEMKPITAERKSQVTFYEKRIDKYSGDIYEFIPSGEIKYFDNFMHSLLQIIKYIRLEQLGMVHLV